MKAYNLYFKSLGYVSSLILILNFILNQAVQTGKYSYCKYEVVGTTIIKAHTYILC